MISFRVFRQGKERESFLGRVLVGNMLLLDKMLGKVLRFSWRRNIMMCMGMVVDTSGNERDTIE